jgi:membrane-bound metal-dependent hydrolase YbcI (DUF457 family)
VALGSWSPDLFTKWLVWGVSVGPLHLQASDPVEFHRGWPGAGFTHSLAFGLAMAALIFLFTHSKVWALGFMVGQWAHVTSDALDSVGVMLLFPFSTSRVHFDAWTYAAEAGRMVDGAAYFSSLGFAWDGVWLALALINWRVLTFDYFRENVLPRDPFWKLVGRFLPLPALLALYRGAFLYGAGRWVAWLIWVHVLHSYAFDLSWGGPDWVKAAL